MEVGGGVEERGEGWMKEERESEEEAELNGRTMAECTRVQVAGRFSECDSILFISLLLKYLFTHMTL